MAKPITGGGIPTPVYNWKKNTQKRVDKFRENVSQRVQDWNTAVDKFSTRGVGQPKTQPTPRRSKLNKPKNPYDKGSTW